VSNPHSGPDSTRVERVYRMWYRSYTECDIEMTERSRKSANRNRVGRPLQRLRDRLSYDDPDKRLIEEIAVQITEQRIARDLSQKELAELCATSQPAIARLESGARPPRIDTLQRVANALDCELEVRLRPRTKTKKEKQGEK
jgi:ribosome-binding protein aMBF1 (putative translation factor)